MKTLSIKADATGLTNCLIEGDNYDSLTFLKNSGVRVDCIYIDPPYNTGNKDFVYNDKYIDSEDTWRHSSWLSFMNKRLKLAKELLTEDGVIFISIDDNEQAQLKLLCDSVFGASNFISNIVWRKQGGGKQDSKYLANNCEYILTYRKSKALKGFNGKPLEDKVFNKIDENGTKYRLMSLDFGSLSYSPSLDYPIELPNGVVVYPGGDKQKHLNRLSGDFQTKDWCWRCTRKEFERRLNKGDIEFTHNSKTGRWKVQEKLYWLEGKTTIHENIITDFTNRTANNQIRSLFGSKIFSYPKPTNLIEFLVRLHSNKNATILDFFAGSGTTGHAVLELNKEDGGDRHFILCTNNENNIAEKVTYERLNRVINGYTTPKGEEVIGIPSNLKYYKVENIDAGVNQMEVEDTVIENISPFIQFKHNVWNKEYIVEDLIKLTSEKEDIYVHMNTLYLCDDFYDSIKSSDKPTTLYIYDGLFDMLDDDRLGTVKVLSLTNEFYKNLGGNKCSREVLNFNKKQ